MFGECPQGHGRPQKTPDISLLPCCLSGCSGDRHVGCCLKPTLLAEATLTCQQAGFPWWPGAQPEGFHHSAPKGTEGSILPSPSCKRPDFSLFLRPLKSGAHLQEAVKVLDQQEQHLDACWTCKLSGPVPELLTQKPGKGGPENCLKEPSRWF